MAAVIPQFVLEAIEAHINRLVLADYKDRVNDPVRTKDFEEGRALGKLEQWLAEQRKS